jgi:uncharacterized protein DUF1775
MSMRHAVDWVVAAGHRMTKQIGLVLVSLAFVSSIAWARVVVFPATSTPGAYEKYSLRIINERDVPTLRVEIRFPTGLRVISFGDVPGWKVRVLADSAQRVTGAIWTGVLEKQHFVEFPFLAVNPKEGTTLTWPTFQTYQGGERMEWTSPDTTSKNPVATTLLSEASPPPPIKVSRTSLYLSIIALALALTSLGVALRPRGDDINP